MTPGRKPSISTSASSISCSSTSVAPGLRGSIARLRRPRPMTLSSPLRNPDCCRSMRITSAPMSASNMVAKGAGPIAFISITFTPASAPAMVVLSICYGH
ncbi:hypothetical protein D3C81_1654730 [compost metagenome]